MRIYANDGVPHEVAPRSYVRWKNSMKSAKVVGKTAEYLQKSLEKRQKISKSRWKNVFFPLNL